MKKVGCEFFCDKNICMGWYGLALGFGGLGWGWLGKGEGDMVWRDRFLGSEGG